MPWSQRFRDTESGRWELPRELPHSTGTGLLRVVGHVPGWTFTDVCGQARKWAPERAVSMDVRRRPERPRSDSVSVSCRRGTERQTREPVYGRLDVMGDHVRDLPTRTRLSSPPQQEASAFLYPQAQIQLCSGHCFHRGCTPRPRLPHLYSPYSSGHP